MDGTLLPPPSLELRFLRFLRWQGELGAANAGRWLLRFGARLAADLTQAASANKRHLTGVPVSAFQSWRRFTRKFPPALFPAALERLRWHAAQGHAIVLVSGTLLPLAEIFSEALPGKPLVCATQLEVQGGILTGEVLGVAVAGKGKRAAIACAAAEHGMNLPASFAYGDRYSDRWMLACVGNPVAVNPSWPLARLAAQRGWSIVNWRRESERTLARQSPEKTFQETECSIN
jgi:HAD superfamily hydrolase (TIGR01490 family)